MFVNEAFKRAPSSNVPDLSGFLIDDGRLRLLDVIGCGAWGIVYRAVTVSSPHTFYAVKCISPRSMTNSQRAAVAQEVNLHEICAESSPHVLQVIDVIEEPESGILFIITEFCEDGDLLEQILSKKFIGNDDLIRDTFVQILDAVDACHKLGIYHRDLKPENIMCKDDKNVVLGDFGFATKRRATSDFRMGSEPFMSPEVRGGLQAHLFCFSSPQADIWALGVILMNLITACLPWGRASTRDSNFMAYLLHDHDHLYHSFGISRDANEILKSVFTVDPRKRTSIADLRARVLEVKTFGPGRLTKTNLGRYISVDSDLDTDSDTLSSSSASASDCESGPLHVVNGIVTNESDAAAASVTVDFVQTDRASQERSHSSSFASSGIGSLVNDGDEIVPVLVHTVPITEADITDEVLNHDSDSNASDAESEGPITPETHAVDETAAAELEDIDDLAELDLSDMSPFAKAAIGLTMYLAPGKGKTSALTEQMDAQGDNADGQLSRKIMLRNAVRRMGVSTRRKAN